VAGKPLTVMRRACLPLAPIERAAPDAQRKIVEFLTLRDAIRLMLASTGLHDLVQADPWFRQDDLLRSLQELGLNELADSMQSLQAEIARLQLQGGRPALLPHGAGPGRHVQPGTFVAGALPEAAVLGVLFADYCCNLLLARSATKTARADERARLAEVRDKEALLAQAAERLQGFEPQIERVVFHYVSERLERPRLGHDLGATATGLAASATGQAAAVPADGRGILNHAIENGDVAQVRLLVRKLLRLPEAMMPSARKLDRLVLQAQGPLEFFGQHMCGFLKRPEQRQYEAITACADEIVSAGIFSSLEELKLMSKLADICRSAMSSDYINPAVAASILLGVSESSASPELKQTCLAAMGGSWHGGVAGFVDFVSEELLRYRRRAPEWVNDLVARLQGIKQALPDFN
jgi:hypothetical protein